MCLLRARLIFFQPLAALFIAGFVVAGFIWRRLPAPRLAPDGGETDGSIGAAYLVFVLPMANWFLWKIGGRRGLGAGVLATLVGIALGAVCLGG